MPYFGQVRVEGDEQLIRKLEWAERKKITEDAINEYSEWLKEEELAKYPQQRRVTRRAAYGGSFFSERQRRWFFAALRSGELELPYSRTDTLRNSWELRPLSTENVMIENTAPYGIYVIDDVYQSRMARAIGWETVSERIQKTAHVFAKYLHFALLKHFR